MSGQGWAPRRGWALSHHAWRWFAIGKPWGQDLAGLRWFILAAFCVTLTVHFLAFFSVWPFIVSCVGFVWGIWYHHKVEDPEHGVDWVEKVWWALLGVLAAWEIGTAVLS